MKHKSLLFLSVILCLVSCGGGGPCGGAGQACCGWPSNGCGSDSLSCQSGTCQACGYEGGPCCGVGYTCSNPNLHCDSTPSTPWHCAACGHIGQPACYNNLCVTGMFSGGRCVDPGGSGGSSSTCSGGTTFYIGVRSAASHCAYNVVAVRANTLDEAKACAARADQSVPGYGDAEGIEGTDLQYFPRKCTTTTGLCSVTRYPAFSEDDATRCAQYNCMGGTVASGDTCP
jgi:hypothetical protein